MPRPYLSWTMALILRNRLASGNANHEGDGFSIRQDIIDKEPPSCGIDKERTVGIKVLGVRVNEQGFHPLSILGRQDLCQFSHIRLFELDGLTRNLRDFLKTGGILCLDCNHVLIPLLSISLEYQDHPRFLHQRGPHG